MAKKPSDRNTKTEILAAYNELAQEKAALEAELRQLRRELKTPSPATSPATSQAITAATSTSSAASATSSVTSGLADEVLSVAATIDQLSALQNRFSGTIGQLSETLAREAIGLRDLQVEVTEERDQLTELHELTDLTDETLANLVQEHQDCAKAFTETFEQERDTLEEELEALQQAWQTEQEDHERTVTERDHEYVTSRDRAITEHEYRLELERNLDQEQYEATRSAQYRELDEERETREREWKERETALAEREKDYRELKAKVEAHEDKLKAEKKHGEDTGRGIAKRQAQVKEDLRAKEIEGETKRYELRVRSLRNTLVHQESQVAQLNQQLESALRQVQDLAVKAIEGAANERSLQAVKDIAIEQAKNSQRGK